MRIDADKLAHIYANARYTLAQDDANQDAVRTGKLFGAKRDCRTLEAVFPQLTSLSFSLNEQTCRWEVSYGDAAFNQWGFTRPAAAVAHAKMLIRELFKEGCPHAD